MSRTPVFRIECGRCGRKEYLEEDELTPENSYDLSLTFMGEIVQFPELCSSCRKTVSNYVKQIKKEAKKKGDKPPSSTPPPDSSSGQTE